MDGGKILFLTLDPPPKTLYHGHKPACDVGCGDATLWQAGIEQLGFCG